MNDKRHERRLSLGVKEGKPIPTHKGLGGLLKGDT